MSASRLHVYTCLFYVVWLFLRQQKPPYYSPPKKPARKKAHALFQKYGQTADTTLFVLKGRRALEYSRSEVILDYVNSALVSEATFESGTNKDGFRKATEYEQRSNRPRE